MKCEKITDYLFIAVFLCISLSFIFVLFGIFLKFLKNNKSEQKLIHSDSRKI